MANGFIDALVSGFTGAAAGAGTGMAAAGKMAYEEEIQQRRDEMAYNRQRMLKELEQQFDRPFKDRAATVAERHAATAESQAAESGRHNQAMEGLRGKEVEQQAAYQKGMLGEHAADRASRERMAKQQAKNITTLEDGTLATLDPETNQMRPITDPATGNALKGQKDLSVSDKTKVAFLQSAMLELQKEQAKAFDDNEKKALASQIGEYRKQLYGILGMELSPAQAAGGGGGGGRPWERYQPKPAGK